MPATQCKIASVWLHLREGKKLGLGLGLGRSVQEALVWKQPPDANQGPMCARMHLRTCMRVCACAHTYAGRCEGGSRLDIDQQPTSVGIQVQTQQVVQIKFGQLPTGSHQMSCQRPCLLVLPQLQQGSGEVRGHTDTKTDFSQHSTAQHYTTQHMPEIMPVRKHISSRAAQRIIAKHNTTQHSTDGVKDIRVHIQHSTAKRSTVKHSTSGFGENIYKMPECTAATA